MDLDLYRWRRHVEVVPDSNRRMIQEFTIYTCSSRCTRARVFACSFPGRIFWTHVEQFRQPIETNFTPLGVPHYTHVLDR